ncbi:hypothetical protein Dvar_15370 [Desulfosarcina variabilis str. Montpellier]|uniref:hypothetical protein n=1 Tax=Desulfosarcina variabilis TaxID=2300 RepID=UPI003AFA6033
MDSYDVFPNTPILSSGAVGKQFLELGITTFSDACRFVHELPYGYNSNRDDLMILFKEKMGTCTTKHAVIATLALELNLPIEKNIGIYAMTEQIVNGTDRILEQYNLPYVPMVHCFLAHGNHRVDLTEGNANGKKQAISEFLHTERVVPNVSAKDEYLKYRHALKENILKRSEMQDIDMKTILHAREKGLELLKANLDG